MVVSIQRPIFHVLKILSETAQLIESSKIKLLSCVVQKIYNNCISYKACDATIILIS